MSSVKLKLKKSNLTSPAMSSASAGIANQMTPLHLRKYTPHSYFSNTLRDIVANTDAVVVMIPQPNTELHLRKSMFKIYKDQSIRTLREYEQRLRELVQDQTVTVDVGMNAWIGKRYLFLKSDVKSGVVKVVDSVPLDADHVKQFRRVSSPAKGGKGSPAAAAAAGKKSGSPSRGASRSPLRKEVPVDDSKKQNKDVVPMVE